MDPLIGLNDRDKPLRSKVLAVPKYREQYLRNIRELAEKSLDWKTLGPFVESQAKMVGDAVKAETRALTSYDEFVAATSSDDKLETDNPQADNGGRGQRRRISLKGFADGRRQFLLDYKPSDEPQR